MSPTGETFSSSVSEASETGRREECHPGEPPSGSRSQDQLAPYLKYIALPDVKPYSGTDKGYSFRSFREAFELKYPRSSWGDGELCALFRSKLVGRALSRYEALSREVREADYATLVNAMEKACRAERFTEKVLALGELKKLVKTEGQTVAEFCVELERLTRRAYPEMDETALATERAHLLYEQIVHWKDSYFLTEALESAGNAYERLKETAERIERRNITLSSVTSDRTPMERKGPSAQRRMEEETPCSSKSGRASVARKGGSRSSESRKAEESGQFSRPERATEMPTDSKAEPACFKCREKGHVAKNCNRITPSRSPRSKPGAISLSARLRSTACQMRTPGVKSRQKCRRSPAFGTRMTTVVELFGRSWIGLLDTGSEISILPAKILLSAQDDGYDIDRIVPEFPMDKSKQIHNASGSVMQFTALVEVQLKELAAQGKYIKARVHVSKVDDDVVILGTNVLPLLGYRLVREGDSSLGTPNQAPSQVRESLSVAKPQPAGTEEKEGVRESPRVARIARRAYLAPGAVSWVKLAGGVSSSECLLESGKDLIHTGVCRVERDGTAEVLVANTTEQAMVLRVGEPVGNWAE
ncbi:unnamed protein product, partial [Heligmosomoides polygyrus]|uniref:CCHC-type domain-containing protein n=1 Tax=Heligmosomoides polygyrus TaxID=6339 RepID=A0A183FBB9_HELPZ